MWCAWVVFVGGDHFFLFYFFFFNDTATTEIYTLSLHDALPIWLQESGYRERPWRERALASVFRASADGEPERLCRIRARRRAQPAGWPGQKIHRSRLPRRGKRKLQYALYP